MHISVLGAGSWGSALAIAVNQVARSTTLWSHNPQQVASLNATRQNPGFLPPQIIFPPTLKISASLEDCVASDLLIIATPLNAIRGIITQLSQFKVPLPDLILVSKGFEANTGKLPHEIIAEVVPGFTRFGLLLGPSFAKEVALHLPTAITLAAFDLNFAMQWMQNLHGIPNLRIYAHDDVIGSEVGAALKNVLAIAVGVADGLLLGANARAGLITRSLNELAALVLALGGKRETIYGLTGIGDLILTCTGDLSRNRQVGLALASGKPIGTIIAELGHVAEGVLTAKEIYLKAHQLQIEMPIVSAVYKIIYEKSNIQQEVLNLINREPKIEFLM